MSASELKTAVQAGLAEATRPRRPYDQAKHCGAQCRRTGEPCTRFPVKGKKRCRQHGGASKRGAEHGRYKHGEHTRVVLVSQIAAEVAKVCAELNTPPERVAEVVVRRNVEDRNRRRTELAANGTVDLDIAERLDASDNRDANALLKAAELKKESPTGAPFTITLSRPGADALTVRTASGSAVALRSPSGGLLLPDGRGGYAPAVKRDVDGVEVYEPVLLALPADHPHSNDDGGLREKNASSRSPTTEGT
ncbi:MAG: hypothetical protein JWM53_3350 [bacterium]|nr:hypothetical protein [bacterium]